MELSFIKMHGLGNDFVVIDARAGGLDLRPAELRLLADRRVGVGCDQILVIKQAHGNSASAAYLVYNADGTAAEHCGNGIRCVAKLLNDLGEVADRHCVIEIDGVDFDLFIEPDDRIRVDMGRPRFEPAEIPLVAAKRQLRYTATIDQHAYQYGAVSMGNPHAVFVVDDLEQADVEGIGSALQRDASFPNQVNVGFMRIDSRERVALRVFERGVGETPACGTGACAAVALGRQWGLLGATVDVELRGGVLHIEWSGDRSDPVWMTGPASEVFRGTIAL